jgi:UDP-N-acetylmuramoylalanine--D-glutamate ligase
MRCSFFVDKKVVVFGLGRTGIATIETLIRSNAHVIASDDSDAALAKIAELFPNIAAAQVEKIDWSQQEYLVLSPGVPLYGPNTHPVIVAAHHHNIRIISDIDILYLACPSAKYIGITGTNGKSTTTALVGHILNACGLKAKVGGNIGVAALSLPTQEDGIYVIELSSFQLELLQFCYLDVSVLLNLTPDHLDRHGSMEQYLDAKLNVLRRLQPQGVAISSGDYEVMTPPIHTLVTDRRLRSVLFSTKKSGDFPHITNRILVDETRGLRFDLTNYQYLPGLHNEENILAAYLVAIEVGCEPDKVIEAIRSFKGLEHRMEFVKTFSALTFINDSKATNGDATAKALACYEDIYWIAGGVAKSDGIDALIPLIREKVRIALLIGDAQQAFAKVLAAHGLPYKEVGNLEAALQEIWSIANAKGVVLLSPACASFDQFHDFEDRGEKFKELLHQIFVE